MNRAIGFFTFFLLFSCTRLANPKQTVLHSPTAADHSTKLYLQWLKNKRVALLINQSSIINKTNLLDTLLKSGINIHKIFVPEHGFRGSEQAGVGISDERDPKTNLPIVSLYGKKNKPSSEDLSDVDILVYDIQDVGVRFYTYISTLYNVMDAAAEYNIPILILDRPNPNGDYVDGPVLDPKFKSFVGIVPIPVVYGMTVGELALMINGEGWLSNARKCQLKIIKNRNYNHASKYELPVNPSPNLKTYKALRLYPSLCFFEATKISVGRGTTFPFLVVGGLDSLYGSFTFTPEKTALNGGLCCYGLNLQNDTTNRFTLRYLLLFYKLTKDKKQFISNPHWFDLLAGSDRLRIEIESGYSELQIRSGWANDLVKFKKIRSKYLLYPEN